MFQMSTAESSAVFLVLQELFCIDPLADEGIVKREGNFVEYKRQRRYRIERRCRPKLKQREAFQQTHSSGFLANDIESIQTIPPAFDQDASGVR